MMSSRIFISMPSCAGSSSQCWLELCFKVHTTSPTAADPTAGVAAAATAAIKEQAGLYYPVWHHHTVGQTAGQGHSDDEYELDSFVVPDDEEDYEDDEEEEDEEDEEDEVEEEPARTRLKKRSRLVSSEERGGNDDDELRIADQNAD